jgi:hypothetical protein
LSLRGGSRNQQQQLTIFWIGWLITNIGNSTLKASNMAKIKVTDKVRVTKPGIFDELEGEVLSIIDSNLPYKVNLGPYGTWNFSNSELKLIDNNKQQKQDEQPKRTTKKAV